MKICVFTLGCKVNFYESDSLINDLKNLGYKVTNKLEFADVYVLNTCCVTNEGERKSRQLVARCRHFNENARIIVCGCASQKNAAQFEKLNVNVVLGNANKKEVVNLINCDHFVGCNVLPREYVDNFMSSSQRVRAYLKVQEGCNNFCSYCIIPFTRGRSRSRGLESCLNEAIKLSETCKEIVLTGINLSDYKPSLIELLEKLSNISARIRIGSLEVNVITQDFLERLSKIKNFCPQFHLSLQSGSTKVLKEMNRHYSKEEYLEKVELIRKYFPFASITTDLIVGFPTETEEDFLESLDTLEKSKFFMVHCFPYSKRDGTKASFMPQILNSEKKRREKIVFTRAEKLFSDYILFLKNNNITQQVLIEEKCEVDGQQYWVGHSELFVKCYITFDEKLKENDIVNAKIKEIFNDGVKCV